ncbi:NUDIX domain-containing protein [Streptomyces yatensis]|uniref:NUDIX domain-containing protein n=1 Tax=Streptomyces yatensis TaxID=155177 RepID=UPI001B3C56FF|nr:NUDIX hydrolase [Streptomyces yatensis]
MTSRSPVDRTHRSNDGLLAPSSVGREPAILIAVGEPLTRRFLRLTGQKAANPHASPGGNADAGEDPLETARRETAEETGLELGRGQPRLLLTHYRLPGPRRPLGKIGFIFDGGRLSPEQLRRIRLDPAEHDLWAGPGVTPDLVTDLVDHSYGLALETVPHHRRPG